MCLIVLKMERVEKIVITLSTSASSEAMVIPVVMYYAITLVLVYCSFVYNIHLCINYAILYFTCYVFYYTQSLLFFLYIQLWTF